MSLAKLIFTSPAAQAIARRTFEIVKKYERLASATELLMPEAQAEIVRAVKEAATPIQATLTGLTTMATAEGRRHGSRTRER
ncbi:MAG: hypothetical protein M3X11_06055 [Acidobacteriota bacterium]|nr:hypothetical protein [Acidobacteriota bacterium]